MSNVKTSSQLIKETMVVVFAICIIATVAVFTIFKWAVPALERQHDRRSVERYYEREEYRKEIEAKLQSNEKEVGNQHD